MGSQELASQIMSLYKTLGLGEIDSLRNVYSDNIVFEDPAHRIEGDVHQLPDAGRRRSRRGRIRLVRSDAGKIRSRQRTLQSRGMLPWRTKLLRPALRRLTYSSNRKTV